MKPKEVHLQFDENGHVTHVHTGPGAPEKFSRYVLASPPLKSSYDCRCMPITPEAPLFQNGNEVSAVPADPGDRPVGVTVPVGRPVGVFVPAPPTRFVIRSVSKTCALPTIIRDAAGVVVHHEDHPEHDVYEFEVEAARGDNRASVRVHLGADAGGRLTQAIGAAGAMVRKASSRNARLVRDE